MTRPASTPTPPPSTLMQIERSEIRVFNAVVEAGGFSRAAERLGVSQSAVSQSVANMEHKLGVLLLTRKAGGQLTEAGTRFFSYVRTVLHEERNALDDIAQIKQGALSTLSLAMNSMVNRFYGPALLLEFCERNPLTRLQLDVAPSRALIHGVESERYELGFGPFLHQMPGHLVTRPYFVERRVLAAHESHPELKALQRDPDRTLARLTLLTSYLDESRKPDGERLRDRFGGVWEVGNLEMRLVLARAGMGVTYLSQRVLDAEPGMIAIGSPEIAAIERTVGLYHKKHLPLSEAARRFVAIAERHFADSVMR